MPDSPTGPRLPRPAAVREGGLWLQDLYPGFQFTTCTWEMTRDDIIGYAAIYDPQAFHLDEAAARESFFGELVASAWHTAAVTMRLLADGFPVATGIIGGSVEFSMPSATRPGDVLRVQGQVDDVTMSRTRPGRGSFRISYQTLNQANELRQATGARLIAWLDPNRDGPLGPTHGTDQANSGRRLAPGYSDGASTSGCT